MWGRDFLPRDFRIPRITKVFLSCLLLVGTIDEALWNIHSFIYSFAFPGIFNQICRCWYVYGKYEITIYRRIFILTSILLPPILVGKVPQITVCLLFCNVCRSVLGRSHWSPWIGLYKYCESQIYVEYRWTYAKPNSYDGWGSGYPSANQNCVYLNSDGFFRDDSCDSYRSFVCEMPSSPQQTGLVCFTARS